MDNKKNLIWNTLGVGFNVFNSLFFLIIVARINPLSEAGIFSFSFAFANILCLIGTFGGRIYQVTDSKGEFTDSDYIGFRIITSLTMIFICALFLMLSNYGYHKNLIIILLVALKFIESLSDVCYGIMQKKGCLYIPGQSLFIKSFIGIIGFLITDTLTNDLISSIFALIVINLIVFILFDIFFVNNITGRKVLFSFNNSRKMLVGCFSFFAFTFLSSLIINFPRYPVDIFLSSDMQAIYSIITMPATSVALLGQFIVQPGIVSIAEEYNKNNILGFMQRINKALLILCIFSIISIIATYLVGVPILNFIYKISLDNYKWPLIYVMFGAMFNACSFVFSVALTTMRLTFEQLVAYIVSTIFAISFSLLSVIKFGVVGGICSYPSIMIFQFITTYILFVFKTRNLEDKERIKSI